MKILLWHLSGGSTHILWYPGACTEILYCLLTHSSSWYLFLTFSMVNPSISFFAYLSGGSPYIHWCSSSLLSTYLHKLVLTFNMNYHQQNLSKVCSFCGLASERLRAYSWKRNKCQFNEIQRENSAMHLTTLYCYTCRKKFLDPLNSACRPEAVNKAKLAIVSNMHKFEEHVDTNCFICVQFSEGEQNPSVTADGRRGQQYHSFLLSKSPRSTWNNLFPLC